jgi:DNA-binding PadR family transcriptional regulator
MLRQLEKDGLLSSDWEPGPSGPARRVYSLTDSGRAWLDAWSATLRAYRTMLDNFFSLYSGGTTEDDNAERQASGESGR